MGNVGHKPSGANPTPRSELRSLEKLKRDVELAEACRAWPSARALLAAAGRGAGAGAGGGAGGGAASGGAASGGCARAARLQFRLFASKKVSKAMLPVLWRVRKMVVVEATDLGNGGGVFQFSPLQFYVVFGVLRDMHNAAASLAAADTGAAPAAATTAGAAGLRASSYDDTECSLCMENTVDVVTTCAHAFCNDCLQDWMDQNPDAPPTCPLCRGSLQRATSSAGDETWVYEDADGEAGDSTLVALHAMGERLVRLLEAHRVAQSMLDGDIDSVGGEGGKTTSVETSGGDEVAAAAAAAAAATETET